MDVAEFFVLRGARGKGVGTSAAHALFAGFPGKWEIRIRRTNVEALRFWLRTAEALARVHHPVTPSPFVANGVDWDLLQIELGNDG
jgi:predicted acetyltransferase